MDKKYLVFISSSREDLKAEYREIIKIVSELGAIPVTMDTFDITQDKERRLICKTIEECDYFLNLTAYKGGGAVGDSFALEIEYSHAVRAGIPVLALIIDEKARWKASKKEKDSSAAKALELFKKDLKAHTVDTWLSMGDLKQKALALLIREMNLNPRRGWVPSTMRVDPSVANTLSQLVQENNVLRNWVNAGETDTIRKSREQMKHVLKMLALNRISLSFYYTDGQNWENSKSFRYLRLFRLLVPELHTPKTAIEISRFLGNILNPDLGRTVRKEYPVPSNTVKKIMADFTALALVKCAGTAFLVSNRKKDEEAWDITDYGKETYTVYRLRQMNTKLPPKNSSTES